VNAPANEMPLSGRALARADSRGLFGRSVQPQFRLGQVNLIAPGYPIPVWIRTHVPKESVVLKKPKGRLMQEGRTVIYPDLVVLKGHPEPLAGGTAGFATCPEALADRAGPIP